MIKTLGYYSANVALSGLLLLSFMPPAAAQQSTITQPAPSVVVRKAGSAPSTAPLQFNGQVEAIEAVDIQARITGFLKVKSFEQGSAVKTGDLLFEIEPDWPAPMMWSGFNLNA
ncbi:hypothetical protein [Ochrobactrum teleogrylli]